MKLAVASVVVLGLSLASPGMSPAFAQGADAGPEYKKFSPPDIVEEKQQPFTIVEISDNDLRSYAQAMVVIMGIDDY
jgi:hypothetical protein